MSQFKKIVERNQTESERQIDQRIGAYAESTFNDRGTVLKPGDVINMPYEEGQQSLIEAIGAAYITASGRL